MAIAHQRSESSGISTMLLDARRVSAEFDSVGLSAIRTSPFNGSRGGILLPALFHLQLNNPYWPDAQLYDTCPFVAVAVIVVWINHRTVLTHERAVIEVMTPENGARQSP